MALVTLGLAGCSGDIDLEVVLHTDVPVAEFASVELDLGTAPFETFQERVAYEPLPDDDYLDGVSVALFSTIPCDDYFLTVELRDDTDTVVAVRELQLRLEDTQSLTVTVDQGCQETVCPSADGPGDRTSCSGGVCVNPFCSPIFREACEPGCTVDTDCEAAASCSEVRCVEGVCLTGSC